MIYVAKYGIGETVYYPAFASRVNNTTQVCKTKVVSVRFDSKGLIYGIDGGWLIEERWLSKTRRTAKNRCSLLQKK